MSSRELKALTARNDDWFNIPIEGYVGNVGEENDDYNPEEDVESMYLTAVDCGVLKRYIESEETYQDSLVCDDCLTLLALAYFFPGWSVVGVWWGCGIHHPAKNHIYGHILDILTIPPKHA